MSAPENRRLTSLTRGWQDTVVIILLVLFAAALLWLMR